MDERPLFILPASATPGAAIEGETAKTPEGVVYFRFYAGAVCLVDLGALALGFFTIFGMAFASSGPRFAISNLLSGLFWIAVGGLHLTASLIALFGGRRPWVHTLGMVLVVLSLTTCCCTPFGIPVLIAFNNPEVKRFYGG